MNSNHKVLIFKLITTILLTAICLFVTNKLWIKFYPTIVSLNIDGNGKINIEAQLNKKDDTEFKKVKAEDITLYLKNNSEIKLNINRAKYPKRLKLKFNISSSENLSNIYINKIYVQKHQIKIKNKNDFISKNAKIVINKNTLIITPQEYNFEIICLEKLNIKPDIKIHFYVVTTIFILIFLIIYKLIGYICNFKVYKKYPTIEIIFLIIFFVILFIPMSKIDTAKNMAQENRMIATFPSIINNDKTLNKNFGIEFNNWFNDRFFGRSALIEFNVKIECQLNKNYCGNELATLYKDKNIIYLNRSWGLAPLTNNKENILKAYTKNINKLTEFCKNNDIKLYILIAPRQVDFFDNSNLYDNRKDQPDPADEVIEYLKTNTKANIIYPKDILLKENKNQYTFFKTDNHWTEKGAFIGYQELMKVINKDFKNISIIEEKTLNKTYDNKVHGTYGDGISQIGLSKNTAKKMMDTKYLYYKNPLYNQLKISNYTSRTDFQKENGDYEFFYKKGLNKKTIVIGNSFSESLMKFLPYSFETTIRLADHIGKRNLNFDVYKNLLLDEKPDILILCFQTTYMFNLLNLYPNEYSRFGDE